MISRIDSEYILAKVLQKDRLEIILGRPSVSAEQAQEYRKLLAKRSSGYPLQYILGSVSFMGIELEVNEDVFIPRFETEILVEKVAETLAPYDLPFIPRFARDYSRDPEQKRGANLLVADVGTGSGNIAIGLTKNLEDCKILASDISDKAIKVAKSNAGKNGVEDRITFLTGDLFSPFGERYYNSLDAVVSNPPYIKRADIDLLQVEIQHEPKTALDGGAQGLDFVRSIAAQGRDYLKKNGLIAMEIGFEQKDAVEDILNEENYKEISFFKDYHNIDRIVIAKRG